MRRGIPIWGRINARRVRDSVKGKHTTIAGSYLDFYENLYEAIREGAPLAVDPEEARNVIRIIEAAYLSSREKRVVKLD